MPSEIQQNRYDQTIRRVAGLVGPGSKVAEALTELFPVIDVERVPMELLALGGVRTGSAAVRLAGVAAQIPKIQLFNLEGSGNIVTVTSVFISVETDALIEFNTTAAQLSTLVGGEEQRDTRFGVAAPTATVLLQESSAGGIPTSWGIELLANTPFVLQDPNGVVVLAPGTGITFDTAETNRTLLVTFFYRERVAEAAELNF